MINYLYDGSFEGLLTAVYESFYRSDFPDNILKEDSCQTNFLFTNVNIQTDYEKYLKVRNSIKSKISPLALKNVFYAFLSEQEDIEMMILYYLKVGWKVGPKINHYVWNDTVSAILKISRRVSLESHKFLGLVRFRKITGGVFYSTIGPDYNIITLIAPHFAKRLSDQNWIIHDIHRNIAALYNQREWVIAGLVQKKDIELHENELDFQELWKTYYNNISIKGRKNDRQQRQFMPVRYWKHLIEKQ